MTTSPGLEIILIMRLKAIDVDEEMSNYERINRENRHLDKNMDNY